MISQSLGLLRPLLGKLSGPAGLNFLSLCASRGLAVLNVLLITSAVARYLGPEQFGIFSTAVAFVTLLSPVAAMGMTHLLVREYIACPNKRSLMVSSVLSLRSATSVALFLFAVAYSLSRESAGDSRTTNLVILLTLLLCSFETFADVLRAELLASRLLLASSLSTIVGAVLRVFCIQIEASIVPFAVVHVVSEACRLGITFYCARSVWRVPAAKKIDRSILANMLRESWPLLVSHLSAASYASVDVLMVSEIRGEADAGIYSIANRLCGFFYFIPTAIASSILPSLVKKHQRSKEQYAASLLNFLRINALAGLGISVASTLCAPHIIPALFGAKYNDAIPVFSIQVVGMVFFFLGTARGQHLVVSGKTKFALGCQLLGVAVNIGLNVLLIPKIGIIGAAIATLFAQVTYGLLSSFLTRELYSIGKLQVRALFSPIPRQES